ncbi:MAG: penicillin-binding protein 2 [Candidatus Nealsonbacteria bacterium RIFOXYC1_FULL_40_7]|uniref:Penicillin-binding protein 2 n=1 Tax=Candidatus Nealsonbacteria bacterium RIFOXYC1_FULL_40_7 TaxID=1801678 RepID=A0A1G2EQ27_9BACT|nr:MAG: penicillin-binding protein 2 [Candidatus Nealsonbacteria bacterium RIFOXYC1_FULL_40_7]OGZ28696.1 MAG: penicillin-binding protein 2 [Candidatus Nealsonbacteria bacterium RIFOXYD1_FULL_39_11]
MLEYPLLKKIRKLKIKRQRDIEPQEVFLDELAGKKEEEIGVSENKLEVPLSRKIILSVFGIFLLSCLYILSQAAYYQIFRHEEFLALANKNKFVTDLVKAERGVIYDANGTLLASNQPSFDLALNIDDLPEDKEGAFEILSGLVNRPVDEIKELINNSGKSQEIIKNLDHESLIFLKARISQYPWLEIKKTSTRKYKDGQTFSHLIGYTGKISGNELDSNYSLSDYVGKEGIEKAFEQDLKEKPGKIQAERDVHGNLLSEKVLSLPESGNSLVLWLDSELQKKAEEELIKTLEKTKAKKGVAIAMDPKTGGILALVSIPSYDNNLFSRGADKEELAKIFSDPLEPLFNRAIAGLYPSGSTIKPLLSSAALQEKIINPNKDISCQGAITVKNQYNPSIIYTYKDNAIHGATDMRKAIAESCNVYFFTLGGGYGSQQGLGPTRIKEYLELFGWSNKTKIDLPGEATGFIPSPEWKKEAKKQPWTDGDTYNISIGQGDLLITPIQVVSAFSALANGGTLLKPQVVKQIVDQNKEILREIEPEIIRAGFIDSENLQIAREGMRMAVTGIGAPQASSVSLNSLSVSSAAKTGTAETPYKNVYHNWITVFAPYENPEIVLTIMIENVPGVQAAAIPTAKGILEWYFKK